MPIFYPDGDAQGRGPVRRRDAAAGGGSDGGGWFDAVQHLIAHGHRLPDILNYTLGQVRGFLEATARLEAAQDARLLSLSPSAAGVIPATWTRPSTG